MSNEDTTRDRRYRTRALLRRLFGVATIDGRYCVTWVTEDDALAYRRWRWWDPRDWRPFRG